jgi:hypothetical protein
MAINYKSLIFIFLLFVGKLNAQFSGLYAPANWGTVAVNSDGQTNSAGAPLSISMTSGDNLSGLPGTNDYTISVPVTGLLTFSWSYSTVDGPAFDYPQFGVNGNIAIVNGFSLGNGQTQSGSQPCVPVNQGDVFRFRMYTSDNIVGPATCVFSNFSFSTPNLTISPASPSVCPGGTIALTASGGSNYSWSGGISNGVPFTPTASGVYTVSTGSGLCISTKTVFLTFNPPLLITGPTSNICANSSATLIASGGTTYSWSTGQVSTSITVNPSINTTYTVFGTSNAGCNTQGVKTVTVDNTPTVTAVSSNSTNGSCPNSPLSLTGQGATTYSWSGGITNAVAFTPTVSNVYTVTGSNACGSATAAISVSIHPIPPITASVNNPTVCSGSSVILNGGGGISYTWTPSVPNNVAFVPGTTFNYTVRGTSALGCTASAVQGITVLITPTLTPVATPTAICFGSTVALTASGATGYTWTPGSNPNTPSIVVSPPVPTTYTVNRTNGPCASTSTVFVLVYPLPLVNASATPSQICAGTGVNFVVVGPVTQTVFPPGFTASNFTVFPNNSVTYTVVGSNGNCTLSAVVPIVVNPSPVIAITSSTNTICEGQSVNLTANGTGPLTYTWQPSNSNNPTEVITPQTTTIVSLAATNSFSCVTTVNQLIVVDPVPDMSLISSIPFACEGQGATISVANPSSNVIYTWNTGPVGPSIQVNPIVTTTYFASGTNTLTGCQNSNSITLSVFISTFSVVSPTAICKGTTATLTASGPATSYTWTVPGAVVAPSVAVTPLNNITYYVTGSNGSCSSTQTLPIIVNPLPNVTASVAKSQICKFEIATITGNGATSYSWSTGATTQVLTFTLGITTSYTLTGIDNNGCRKSTSVTQFVAICPGIGEGIVNNLVLNVYPNPNNGDFIISTDVSMTVNIVNAMGQVLSTLHLTEDNENKVTVSDLPAGIYFISSASSKLSKKILVE